MGPVAAMPTLRLSSQGICLTTNWPWHIKSAHALSLAVVWSKVNVRRRHAKLFRQTIPNLPVIGSCWVALIFSTQKCQNDPKRVSVVHKIRSIQPSKGKSQKKHHGLTIQHWDFHGFPVIGSSVLNSSVRKTHPSSAQPRVSAVTTWPGRFSWPIYNMICVTTNKKSEDTFAFFDDIYDIYEPRTIYLVHHICNFVGCSYHVSESRSAFCNLNFVFSCIFGNQATPQYYSFT